MAKVHATRTYAPLQFEALEPHRFEDLVRDLIYDFRDWQTIEATGRSGGDDGYDIRAFEKRTTGAVSEDDAEADEDRPSVVEGNRWMMQCKREKELGPARIKAIIEDAVSKADPPYGYIIAAPANFSKKSYDTFRSALTERGVQEFHLFGRAELEDMLYMPKNDRILFAFFGVSLATRKRTRVSEIRTSVNNKNKLYSAFGADSQTVELSEHVLLRDINDTHYPHAGEYDDFDNHPRWRECITCEFYPEGLRIHVREHFAYVNHATKEWDFAAAVDLLHRDVADEDDREAAFDLRRKVKHFWERLPRMHQGKYVWDGIIRYENFQLIDKQGDALYKFPHLFVEFRKNGPLDGIWVFIKGEQGTWTSVEDYKRVEIFPKVFPEPTYGTIYKDRSIELPEYLLSRLQHSGREILYDVGNKYGFLKPRDVIHVAGADERNTKVYVEITHRYGAKFPELLADRPHLQWELEQSGGGAADDGVVNVLELLQVYDHQLERSERS